MGWEEMQLRRRTERTGPAAGELGPGNGLRHSHTQVRMRGTYAQKKRDTKKKGLNAVAASPSPSPVLRTVCSRANAPPWTEARTG